ncbi:MAG: Sir2 family NAD-dependent protein deacetylase [Desulfatiglandaceae bacterium]
MNKDLSARIQTMALWLYEASYPVVFTGAGMSTESGLPDFRGPDGVWTRQEKGLPPKPMTMPWDQVPPNPGHYALVDLLKLGRLRFLISQNVDNLHRKSGIPSELIAELHGNIARLRCRRCGKTTARSEGRQRCACGGELVQSVVDFGESLPEQDLTRSFEHSRRSDLFIVLGSSLMVTPAADMPREALKAGAKLVIVNRENTPFDPMAHLKFQEGVGEVLPRVVKRLKRLMGYFE